MRASNTFANDLEKVMDVTKDQILMALSKEPTSMDKFTEDLPKFGKVFSSTQVLKSNTLITLLSIPVLLIDLVWNFSKKFY